MGGGWSYLQTRKTNKSRGTNTLSNLVISSMDGREDRDLKIDLELNWEGYEKKKPTYQHTGVKTVCLFQPRFIFLVHPLTEFS